MNTTTNPNAGALHSRPAVEVLVVEDSASDARLVTMFLEQAAVPVRSSVARNGEEAMERLTGRVPGVAPLRPDLVLLDLNLPGKDGRQVLSEIKSDPALRSIPVVVLSTSRAPDDVRACYERQANAYMWKADDLDGFQATIESIEAFWLRQAELPSN